MANENLGALFEWGRAVVQAAASAGIAMQGVPDSNDLKDFVAWAKAVAPGMSGFASLPTLTDDAVYVAALSWARALDGAARGMGADLPALPQG